MEKKLEPQNTSEVGVEQSHFMAPPRWKGEIKANKFKILAGVLGILVFVGAVFGAYKLGQRRIQPTPQPTPTPAVAATPTPDLTADWKVFTSEEYGFEFKYPERLKIEENKYQGERGYAYCLNFKKSLSIEFFSVQNVYAGAAGCYFEDFGIGGISTDFEAGRSGEFTDTRGYRKEDDRIIFKFAGTKEYEIPQELVKQVFTNPNQVEIVVVEGKSYEESPFPVMGTPGDGYLGALINTKHPYLTGLAIVYSRTSSLLSEEEFYLMLSTFRFLEEAAFLVTPTPTPIPLSETYIDKDFGYQISYPADWLFRRTYGRDIQKIAQTDILSGIDLHYNPTPNFTQTSIVVNLLDAHGLKDIEEWIAEYDLNYPKNAQKKIITFKGLKAVEYKYQNTPDRENKALYFISGGYAYRIFYYEKGGISDLTRRVVENFRP